MRNKALVLAALVLTGFTVGAGVPGLIGRGVAKAVLSRSGETAAAKAGVRVGAMQVGKAVVTTAGSRLAQTATISVGGGVEPVARQVGGEALKIGGRTLLERMSATQILAVGAASSMIVATAGGAVAANEYADAATDAKCGVAAVAAENLPKDGELARKLAADPNATPEQRKWVKDVGNRHQAVAESTQSSFKDLVEAVLSPGMIILTSIVGALSLFAFCPRWRRWGRNGKNHRCGARGPRKWRIEDSRRHDSPPIVPTAGGSSSRD